MQGKRGSFESTEKSLLLAEKKQESRKKRVLFLFHERREREILNCTELTGENLY